MAKQRSYSASFDSDTAQPVQAAMPEPAIPVYDNSADTNALQQYIDALYPAKEKKREETYRKVAMGNAAGNILRSFFDAIGAANGAPVTPLNNDKYMNQYHQIMQQNLQRQDRVNQYMLQETSRRLAQGEAYKQEDAKIVAGRKYNEGVLARQQEDKKNADRVNFEQQMEAQRIGFANQKERDDRQNAVRLREIQAQGEENRKTANARTEQTLQLKRKLADEGIAESKSTGNSKFSLYDTVDGKYVKVKDVDAGELNKILADVISYPDAMSEFEEMYPEGSGTTLSLEQKKYLVQKYWPRVRGQITGITPERKPQPTQQQPTQQQPTQQQPITYPAINGFKLPSATTNNPNDPFGMLN